jgi:hypothetical protein
MKTGWIRVTTFCGVRAENMSVCVSFAGLILMLINKFVRSNYVKQSNSLVFAGLVLSTCFISLELDCSGECYHFWIGVLNAI